MVKRFLFLSLLLISYNSYAQVQTTTANMTGEYYLQGVMETASGFKLNADSSFEFFFSYGALDRYGAGNWRVQGDKLVLNSRPKPAADFTLKTSKKVAGQPFILVKLVDANPQVVQFVHVQDAKMDSHGEAVIKAKSVDSLTLLFELCPEKKSVLTIPDKSHNYFEFAFESWILELFFENAEFTITDKKITGKHPLLTGRSYDFVKSD